MGVSLLAARQKPRAGGHSVVPPAPVRSENPGVRPQAARMEAVEGGMRRGGGLARPLFARERRPQAAHRRARARVPLRWQSLSRPAALGIARTPWQPAASFLTSAHGSALCKTRRMQAPGRVATPGKSWRRWRRRYLWQDVWNLCESLGKSPIHPKNRQEPYSNLWNLWPKPPIHPKICIESRCHLSNLWPEWAIHPKICIDT